MSSMPSCVLPKVYLSSSNSMSSLSGSMFDSLTITTTGLILRTSDGFILCKSFTASLLEKFSIQKLPKIKSYYLLKSMSIKLPMMVSSKNPLSGSSLSDFFNFYHDVFSCISPHRSLIQHRSNLYDK